MLGQRGNRKVGLALDALYVQMTTLERKGKNRIWARLIRNRYAALFYREHFDLVVGNPPHVTWKNLPESWRRQATPAFENYGLFTLSGSEARHGGSQKDIAALFTYAVLDHFLRPGGQLALIAHVSLFKTEGGGEGFRRFRLGEHGVPFSIKAVHDFSSFQPFRGTAPAVRSNTPYRSWPSRGRAQDIPCPTLSGRRRRRDTSQGAGTGSRLKPP